MPWESVIGLEIHIQLNTQSKAFCSDDAKFSNDPNTQTSIISLAHPGTLPKINSKQIESAIKLGLSMNSEINPASYFERKQYFYPDLPKGYQISQQASPICIGGYLDFMTPAGNKKIRLHHIHMEEDAGKSIHDADPHWSKIDLNRAGVPLLEMVTEPDFRNAEEVSFFLSELQRIVRYLNISDANMEEGSMRCDVNVSVRPLDSIELRERCEIKNVNSRRFARKAIEYEVSRQIQLWESGQVVRRQTMQFVPEEGITIPIRQKEDAHDYRYFPDPDLPPILITSERLADIKKNLPSLPAEYLHQLITEKKLQATDAKTLLGDKSVVEYYLKLVEHQPNLNKSAANWVIQNILPYIHEHKLNIDQFPLSNKSISHLLNAILNNQLTVPQAQEIWTAALSDLSKKMEDITEARISSVPKQDINEIIQEVFASFPEEATAYKNGKKKLLGFLLGEIKKRYPDINIKVVQNTLNS